MKPVALLDGMIDDLNIVKRRIMRLSGFGEEAEPIGDAIAILEDLKADQDAAQILTLDEVRGLVGIPRWAQYYVLSEAEGQAPILQSGWAIVQAFDEDEEHFVSFATAYGMERWHVATYGTRWLMFDKEPKEEMRRLGE